MDFDFCFAKRGGFFIKKGFCFQNRGGFFIKKGVCKMPKTSKNDIS
jgi:hypothetical protein